MPPEDDSVQAAPPTQTLAQGNRVDGSDHSLLHHWSGKRVGQYQIQKLLGRGGMGAVFLATRSDDEFRKNVALKILRFETDDSAVLARFRNERQILAALDHPNIATLYDGGSTEEGLPYIVMEYVSGQPLDQYCEEHKLTVSAKLRLFRQICDAVQYAHQKLIVHRDLKPGNILVTVNGIPKLLDFGIAKLLLEPELIGDAAFHTKTGMLAMTPDYASPEQMRGEPVTTATDIYSLGAVLYELLTGQRPHAHESHEALKFKTPVSEADPKPPSTVGGSNLRGDLDNIVLKALHRDPARRYRSVDQFSEDILRYLENRPVLARPDSLVYRLSRFTSRNRWGIAAVTAIILSLAAGTAVSLYHANLAQERFNQVRKLSQRFIELHDDVARLPGSTAVREKLLTSALDYLDNLSRSAGRDADLLNELGQAYAKVSNAQGGPGQANLGRNEDAMRSLEKAIAIESRAAAIDPAFSVRVATLQSRLAYVSMLSGQLPKARQNLESAAALLDQLRASKPGDAEVIMLAGSVAMNRGDLTGYEGNEKAGLPYFQQAHAFALDYAKLRPGHSSQARVHLTSTLVASSLAVNGRFREALATLSDSEPIIDSLLATEPDNPTYNRQKMTAANYRSLIFDSETGEALNQPAEAVDWGKRYVALAQHLADVDPHNAGARLSLAIASFQLSYPLGKIDPAESLRTVQKAIQIFDAEVAKNPSSHLLRSRRARALRYLAYAYSRNKEPAAARHAIEQAIEIQQQLLTETPSDTSESEQLKLSRKVLQGLAK